MIKFYNTEIHGIINMVNSIEKTQDFTYKNRRESPRFQPWEDVNKMIIPEHIKKELKNQEE